VNEVVRQVIERAESELESMGPVVVSDWGGASLAESGGLVEVFYGGRYIAVVSESDKGYRIEWPRSGAMPKAIWPREAKGSMLACIIGYWTGVEAGITRAVRRMPVERPEPQAPEPKPEPPKDEPVEWPEDCLPFA
jgi:hypothetical protein